MDVQRRLWQDLQFEPRVPASWEKEILNSPEIQVRSHRRLTQGETAIEMENRKRMDALTILRIPNMLTSYIQLAFAVHRHSATNSTLGLTILTARNPSSVARPTTCSQIMNGARAF